MICALALPRNYNLRNKTWDVLKTLDAFNSIQICHGNSTVEPYIKFN